MADLPLISTYLEELRCDSIGPRVVFWATSLVLVDFTVAAIFFTDGDLALDAYALVEIAV